MLSFYLVGCEDVGFESCNRALIGFVTQNLSSIFSYVLEVYEFLPVCHFSLKFHPAGPLLSLVWKGKAVSNRTQTWNIVSLCVWVVDTCVDILCVCLFLYVVFSCVCLLCLSFIVMTLFSLSFCLRSCIPRVVFVLVASRIHTDQMERKRGWCCFYKRGHSKLPRKNNLQSKRTLRTSLFLIWGNNTYTSRVMWMFVSLFVLFASLDTRRKILISTPKGWFFGRFDALLWAREVWGSCLVVSELSYWPFLFFKFSRLLSFI